MNIRVESVEGYLGKPVYDPYGRRVGYVIGFYADKDGKVYSFEISIGDFEFKEVPIDRFDVNNDGLVLTPEWEYNATVVENRIERIKKRISALNELYSKKEIPLHAYESNKKTLENELVKVKDEAKNVREMMRKRLSELETVIMELERTLAGLRIFYLARELSERSYKEAADHIKRQLEVAVREKESVKKHIEKIEALEKQPIDIGVTQNETQQQVQPVPVVVLET